MSSTLLSCDQTPAPWGVSPQLCLVHQPWTKTLWASCFLGLQFLYANWLGSKSSLLTIPPSLMVTAPQEWLGTDSAHVTAVCLCYRSGCWRTVTAVSYSSVPAPPHALGHTCSSVLIPEDCWTLLLELLSPARSLLLTRKTEARQEPLSSGRQATCSACQAPRFLSLREEV